MEYTFHSKLILRTPLMPFKADFTQEELAELFQKPMISEALYLASPNLVSEFEKWKRGGFTEEERINKLFQSLRKYALRLHTRCTPFGLYAMCGTIDWGDAKTIVIPQAAIYRKTRPDMQFTGSLIDLLGKMQSLQDQLRFYPNNSIYAVGERYRYIEYTYKNDSRRYQISAVDGSEYLELILKTAASGATLRTLRDTLIGHDPELTTEETEAFLLEMIEARLLVHELEPAICGKDIFSTIHGKISQITAKDSSGELKRTGKLLDTIQTTLNQADGNMGNALSLYTGLETELEQHHLPFQKGKLLQTDLFFEQQSTQGTLDHSLQRDLFKALTILNKLTVRQEKTRISEFTRKFSERYEYREIPLAQALDNEIGIGYAGNTSRTGDHSPLVEYIPVIHQENTSHPLNWDKNYSFLFKKLLKSIENGETVISLDPEELSDTPDWSDLPDTFAVFFRHCGEKILLKTAGGSSAVNMIGRFTQNNEEIAQLAQEITTYEQSLNPDSLLAEIAHLPENRTGNILARNSFREYEIPYLAQSGLTEERQIPISDLYLSVRNNRLILRSRKLNKRIQPRLGNAHNYNNLSLPVYHFLCDLQFEGQRTGLNFEWGPLRQEFSFLPRVETGKIVLSPATWNIREKELQQLTSSEAVAKWKNDRKIPDMFLIPEGDNELLIHLGTESGCQSFLNFIEKRKTLTVNEFIPNTGTPVVTNEHGLLKNNEFIALLQRTASSKLPETRFIFREAEPIQRTFLPGSEWLYCKWYCGNNTADLLLTEVLEPCASTLLEQRLIDSFFFIRYQDPELHLRVRLHLTNNAHSGKVLELLNGTLEPYFKQGLLSGVVMDSYQRELERYGTETMILSEQLFFHDSLTTIELLNQIDNSQEGQEFRWQFTLTATDRMLQDFGYGLVEKLQFVQSMRNAFAQEFKVNSFINKQIDKKYRTYRTIIETVLRPVSDSTDESRMVMEQLLIDKSNRIEPIVSEIRSLTSRANAPLTIDNLLSSYIHMMINRLIRNKQRLHELMIYDFLLRFYKSESAREQQKNKQEQRISEEIS